VRGPVIPTFGADPNGQAWNSQNKPWYHPGWGPVPRAASLMVQLHTP
jgi:hypothetical protein